MKKIKEKIFGVAGLLILTLVNFFAFDKYLEQSKNNSDIIQKDMSNDISTNTAFSTITMQVSASTSSTITTQPPELL